MMCFQSQSTPDWDEFALTESVILYDAQRQQWLRFHQPIATLEAKTSTEVMPLLKTVEQQVEQGYYAAGFVSYEAAPAFDDRLPVYPTPAPLPLAWFGIYSPPEVITLPHPSVAYQPLHHWQPSITRSQYREAIARIKRYIAQGETYQVNFSFRLKTAFTGDPWSYFLQLIQAQQGHYGAFIQLADWTICCASPELFFRLNDRTLISRPMKGTAPRGLSYARDRLAAQNLQRSEKNQAENLMIVDMIRNDMGKIAQLGSVRVAHLFEVEQYPTLWQMTSPVECLTDASFSDLFRALFPCASITGAPKVRTMEIIAELEDSPRQIYTGAIGFFAPHRLAQFNVAIRTVLIDRKQQIAEYGVGGGIVWDSIETSEFEECCTKAKVLTLQHPQFELLESLLWKPDEGYFLLDFHLKRLQQSAEYFAFSIDLDEIKTQLYGITHTLSSEPYKVRLCVAQSGTIALEAKPMVLSDRLHPLKVRLARTAVDSRNVFLYHKTTHRQVYEAAKQFSPDVDDVLLWNERQELTESCIANVIVELNGQWYTPPVTCGLLAGTMRAWLLEQGKVQERIIHLDELASCSRLFLVNSVRQIQEAIVV